jgi:hypothetical protein
MGRPPAIPRLQEIHGQQGDERACQHDHGQGRGLGILELFQLGHDQQWNDFSLTRQIAGNEDD